MSPPTASTSDRNAKYTISFANSTAEGASVLLVSSELEEIEALCQRAILLHRGKMIDELHGAEIAKDRILHRLLAGDEDTRNDNMSTREDAAPSSAEAQDPAFRRAAAGSGRSISAP